MDYLSCACPFYAPDRCAQWSVACSNRHFNRNATQKAARQSFLGTALAIILPGRRVSEPRLRLYKSRARRLKPAKDGLTKQNIVAGRRSGLAEPVQRNPR